jgi:hypothetical protein
MNRTIASGLATILMACGNPGNSDTDTGNPDTYDTNVYIPRTCEELLGDDPTTDLSTLAEEFENNFQLDAMKLYYHAGSFLNNGIMYEDATFLQADGTISDEMYFCTTCPIVEREITPTWVIEVDGDFIGLELRMNESWYEGSYWNTVEAYEAILTPGDGTEADFIVGETRKVLAMDKFSGPDNIESYGEIFIENPLYQENLLSGEGPNNTLAHSNGYIQMGYPGGSKIQGCLDHGNYSQDLQTIVYRFYSELGFGEWLN